ncbi:helicase-exonuclease AddAB subunit AddA, partial [Lachnospiraceae bacterium OttesenSCG-928-D06]|nr:helicase-exonuclease AddAB subunit AddA [Lachnospiraceae bacterium OttesenSCG-928-D06]
QITTIDSFCLFLVKNHFNEIGLDPAFRTADEGEIRLMKHDVMDKLFEEKHKEKTEEFLYCVEYFCPNGREKTLEEYILSLHQYAESFPWPIEWLKERKADYEMPENFVMEENDYGIYLLRYIHNMLKGCRDTLEQIQRLCQEPDGPYMYGELVDGELEQLEDLLKLQDFQIISERLPAVQFARLPSKKDDSVSVRKRELAKNLRNKVKDTLKDMAERFFRTPLPLAIEQMAACAGPVGTLLDLTIAFGINFKAQKTEKNIMDFSDMEHNALNILMNRENGEIRPSQVAKEYRQYFHEILIDEYQDSNLVQEYLLRAISGEDEGVFNRFMVGDVKQSIYKFRLARPELFLEKYENYSREESVRQCIDLSQNFRSRVQVVDTVNGVFSKIMNKEMGGIDYDEKAALYPGAVYPENPDCYSELLLYEKPKSDSLQNAKQVEALAIANKIKELRQNFQVTDKETGQLRQVNFRDIVILLRTNSGWDEPFKNVLMEEGIPAYITTKTGYFAATEVQEVLQFLKVLDNPRQDIPLFGVMRSIFGGFTDEEIAIIKSKNKEAGLYEILKAECENLEESEKVHNKIWNFLGIIDKYRRFTVYLSIRELLQQIVSDFDYLHYISALPAGSKRKANIEMLFTKASDFEQTSYFGLFHFIRYMEQLEAYNIDSGEAELIDENADVVRIMSIHKSKGLEFPVTFVAGLSKRFNMQDANKSVIVDMDLGIGVDYVDPKRRIRNKTLRRSALSCKLKEDNLAEELRVLYVALTRAREKLILTATMEKAEEKWEMENLFQGRNLTYQSFMEVGSFMDFLLPVIGNTNCQVTIGEANDLIASGRREQIQLMERRKYLEEAGNYTDALVIEHLKMRMSYVYPFKELEGLYTKTTVSELKLAAMAEKNEAAFHTFEEPEIVPYIPAFKQELKDVTGVQRGDAFHKILELLDFNYLYKDIFKELPLDYSHFYSAMDGNRLLKNLKDIIHRAVEEERMPKEYSEILNRKKLLNFAKTEIAYRMWKAQSLGFLYREQPFVYGIAANRLYKDFPLDEKVMIQGIIDVFFEEEDGIVLVDYKTDVVHKKEELCERYETQMEYYEEALNKLTGTKVKEKVIYSFYLEESIHMGKKE